MQSLDLYTIYIVGTLFNLLFAMYLCILWIMYRKQVRGTFLFIAAMFLMLLSQWLFSRTGILHELFTVVMSNTILSLSTILAYWGLVLFSGYKIQIQHKVLVIIPIILLFEQMMFTFIIPSFDVRLITITFCLILPLIICSSFVFTEKVLQMLPGRLLGLSFSLLALVLFVRVPMRFLSSQLENTLGVNVITSSGETVIVIWMLATAFLIFSYIMVVAEKLRVEERTIATDRANLLAELHHRVKNNLMNIEELLSLQSAKSRNPAVRKALEESRQRVLTISTIHRLLQSERDVLQVYLPDYLLAVGNAVIHSYKDTGISLLSHIAQEQLDIRRAVACGMIVSEFITNSCKYAFAHIDHPTIEMRFTKENHNYRLDLEDNGIGIDEDMSIQSSGTLGLSLIRSLASQLNGESHFVHGPGVRFVILFPINVI